MPGADLVGTAGGGIVCSYHVAHRRAVGGVRRNRREHRTAEAEAGGGHRGRTGRSGSGLRGRPYLRVREEGRAEAVRPDDDVVVVVAELRIVVELLACGDREAAPAIHEVGRIRGLRPAEGDGVVAVAVARWTGVGGVVPAARLGVPLNLGVEYVLARLADEGVEVRRPELGEGRAAEDTHLLVHE